MMLIKTADKHNTRVIETRTESFFFLKKTEGSDFALYAPTIYCGQSISLFDQSLTDDDEHNRNATQANEEYRQV